MKDTNHPHILSLLGVVNEKFDIIDIDISFMRWHGFQIVSNARGISSSGRALDLHSRGTGIDTRILHFRLIGEIGENAT